MLTPQPQLGKSNRRNADERGLVVRYVRPGKCHSWVTIGDEDEVDPEWEFSTKLVRTRGHVKSCRAAPVLKVLEAD